MNEGMDEWVHAWVLEWKRGRLQACLLLLAVVRATQ